jgi:(p)ppGpp synthase/HD superfamily hydrolase
MKMKEKEIYYSETDLHQFKVAKEFACLKHAGQKRKFSDTPYVTHPIEVAEKLQLLGCKPAIIVAGYLHDTLEDTDTTEMEIETAFGSEVLHLIQGVTLPDKVEKTEEYGKGEFLAKKMLEMPIDVLTLKLADRASNVRDLATLKDTFFGQRYARETQYILQQLQRRELDPIHQALLNEISISIAPVLEHERINGRIPKENPKKESFN